MTERGTDISTFKRAYRTRNEGTFPHIKAIMLEKEWDLKYGENPNQHAAIYFDQNARTIVKLTDLQSVRSDGKGKGGLSLTNTMDITRAMDNLKWFTDPACVIMKHNIIAGFNFKKQTNGESQDQLYRISRDADRRSCFGGTAVFNRPLEMATVDALFELYDTNGFRYRMDVIAAPGYEQGVLGKLEKYADQPRIGEFSCIDKLPKFIGDETYGLISIKEMPTGRFGVQDIYLTSIKGVENLILDAMIVDKKEKRHVIERDPTKQELDDMLTAWWLNITGARSNGIVFVRNGVSIAIGSGQVERVGAVEQAIIKAMQKAMDREGIEYDPLMGIQGYEQLKDNPLTGAVCSSDAFFPFPDAVQRLGSKGVTAVIQPFGSENDAAVIDEANKYKLAMPATGERCFGHF